MQNRTQQFQLHKDNEKNSCVVRSCLNKLICERWISNQYALNRVIVTLHVKSG